MYGDGDCGFNLCGLTESVVPLENVDEATLAPAGWLLVPSAEGAVLIPLGFTVMVPEEWVEAVPSDGASLLAVGTSSTGQMMNHLLPVCRTARERFKVQKNG